MNNIFKIIVVLCEEGREHDSQTSGAGKVKAETRAREGRDWIPTSGGPRSQQTTALVTTARRASSPTGAAAAAPL